MRLTDIKRIDRAVLYVDCAIIQLDKAMDYLYNHPEHNLRTLSGETQKDCLEQTRKKLFYEREYLRGKASYFREMAIEAAGNG